MEKEKYVHGVGGPDIFTYIHTYIHRYTQYISTKRNYLFYQYCTSKFFSGSQKASKIKFKNIIL